MQQNAAGLMVLLSGEEPGLYGPFHNCSGLAGSDDGDALPIWQPSGLPGSGMRGRVAGSGLGASVYVAGEAVSTFDLAWRLVEYGLLRPWDAALALTQSSGRGQLRRPWYSPAGNLHVSFLLPDSVLFDGPSASVLTALLLIRAFGALGLELKLKWPNDLVLVEEGKAGKLGGLLLEERGGLVMAGLGVNMTRVPHAEMLRKGAILPPALLPESFAWRSPTALWPDLVRNLIMIYDAAFIASSRSRLLEEAEKFLLWRGLDIDVHEALSDEEPLRGRLLGLGANGGLRLLVSVPSGYEEVEVLTGSIANGF